MPSRPAAFQNTIELTVEDAETNLRELMNKIVAGPLKCNYFLNPLYIKMKASFHQVFLASKMWSRAVCSCVIWTEFFLTTHGLTTPTMLSRKLVKPKVPLGITFSRCVSSEAKPLYLNPHKWKGLPADQIFELHQLRKSALGEKYIPNNDERNAILSTFTELKSRSPALAYGYELDNFKERIMSNTPSNMRGLPPKMSNIRVFDKGETPHERRRNEQMHRISAYELPLLAKFRQQYKPSPPTQFPIRLTYNTDFTDEPNSTNRKVSLLVHLKDLVLNDQQAKKFMLLAGNKFNHNTKTFRFSTDRFEQSAQNARWLAETFNKLLAESKDLSKNNFDSVAVDTRHSKPTKAKSQFPESWKRPQDAPVKRHHIVRKYVDDVKRRKDEEYMKSLTP